VCACLDQRVLSHNDAHRRRGVELAHPAQDGGDLAGIHVSAPPPLRLGAVGPRAVQLGRSRQKCWMCMHHALGGEPRRSNAQLVEGGAPLSATCCQRLQGIVNRRARPLLLADLRVEGGKPDEHLHVGKAQVPALPLAQRDATAKLHSASSTRPSCASTVARRRIHSASRNATCPVASKRRSEAASSARRARSRRS